MIVPHLTCDSMRDKREQNLTYDSIRPIYTWTKAIFIKMLMQILEPMTSAMMSWTQLICIEEPKGQMYIGHNTWGTMKKLYSQINSYTP